MNRIDQMVFECSAYNAATKFDLNIAHIIKRRIVL